jgi:hypothetical protein
LCVFRLPALPPWSSVLPHLHPPRLRHQSCSLYPDSTSSTLAIAGNIGILPHCRSTHHDHLRAPLYWSSQTLAFIHGGPYLRASGIGNTGACIHPRRVLGSGKLSAHLIPDGLDTRHLHPRRILAPPPLGASMRLRLLCGFLDIGKHNIDIVDISYLKHSFLDHGYSPSLLAISTSAQRATALLEHSSRVYDAPAVTVGEC